MVMNAITFEDVKRVLSKQRIIKNGSSYYIKIPRDCVESDITLVVSDNSDRWQEIINEEKNKVCSVCLRHNFSQNVRCEHCGSSKFILFDTKK